MKGQKARSLENTTWPELGNKTYKLQKSITLQLSSNIKQYGLCSLGVCEDHVLLEIIPVVKVCTNFKMKN